MAAGYGINDVETSLQDSLDESLVHGIIVSNLAYYVGKELGLPEEDCRKLANAGMLHDIGKLRLRSYVYEEKGATLMIDELRYIRMHPSLGYAILKEQGYDNDVLEAVLYHHENIDGSGYPKNLKGEDIPFSARILRVCDAYGALISNHAYKGSFDQDAAMKTMIDEIRYFDMKVFLAYLKVAESDTMTSILADLGID